MNILRKLAVVCLVLLAPLAANARPIFFDISGSVTQADEYSGVAVGDNVRGWVKIAEEATAPGFKFNLLEGNVLDINVKIGDFRWNNEDPSVDWVQFEGFISSDGLGFDTIVWKLLQNFSGVISNQCPLGQVCSLEGDQDSAGFYYPDFAFGDGPSDGGFSLLEFEWTRRVRPVAAPSTLALLAIGLAWMGSARRGTRRTVS